MEDEFFLQFVPELGDVVQVEYAIFKKSEH